MDSPAPPRTSRPLLEIDAVESGYGRVRILSGITIQVLPGEVVCLIGPNGAGKTTLLRSVSGLCRVTAGTIRFKGQDITNIRPHRAAQLGLGHCPEGRHVFQHLTVAENLVTGHLPARGRDRAGLMDEVFGLFPMLAERRNLAASRLSGGQQQMLAIGRALMGSPELLLLDEPSLGLAPLVIHRIFEIIIRLAETGVSILLVEQNVDLSLHVSDYAYALEHGAIQCSGPSAKLAADGRVNEIFLPNTISPQDSAI